MHLSLLISINRNMGCIETREWGTTVDEPFRLIETWDVLKLRYFGEGEIVDWD